MSSHVYLYAIVAPHDYRNLGAIGVEDALVLVVPEDDLGVAFSVTARERVTPSKADLTAHERVLERLMEECEAVLPFSFGTLTEDRAAMLKLLAVGRDDFRESIGRVRGCIEVGIKVFWQKDAMLREVERFTGQIAPANGKSRSEGEQRSRAIEVGQVVEQLAREWEERYAQTLVTALSPYCRDWRENETIGPTMLWNGSFLVSRDRANDFLDALSRLDRRLGDRLDFRHVSPLPPYSFVQLRISMGAEEME